MVEPVLDSPADPSDSNNIMSDSAPLPAPKPLYILGAGTKKTRPVCKFHASGSCAAGDLCPFEHTTQLSVYEPCLFDKNSQGGCKHGGERALKHDSLCTVESRAAIDGNTIGKEARPTDSRAMEEETAVSDGNRKMSYSQLAGMSPYSPRSNKIITSQLNPSDQLPVLAPQAAAKNDYELCVFAVTGKCRFGAMCRNLHGLQCPRCLLYCLHPYDLEQNEEHIRECLERPMKMSSAHDEEVECGICLERVLSKPDPRFGLLNCEHAFCLACIRQWRSSTTTGSTDPTTVRSCPLCRIVTYFIVPSSQFIRDGEEKARIIEAYKRKVQSIPCRHYDYGRGRCPFGSSCFYSHQLLDGTPGPMDLPRSYVDANEQVKVIREFRLSDFLPGPR